MANAKGGEKTEGPAIHAARPHGVVVVLPAEVEDPVDRVEQDLPPRPEPARAGLADRRFHRDDDLGRREGGRGTRREREREGQHVGVGGVAGEPPVEAPHLAIPDQGEGEPSPEARAAEHDVEVPGEAPGVDPQGALAIGDEDPRTAHSGDPFFPRIPSAS